MELPEQILLLIAVAAGIAFSAIGWAYRAGTARGIPTCHVAVGIGIVGIFWFGWRSFGIPNAPGPSAPALVWTWGIINGMTQGICVYLYRVGLKHGPFAPLWCAGNLVFVTPILFSLMFLGERINTMQVLAILTAGLCIVTASLGQSGVSESNTFKARHTRIFYMIILISMICLTGLCGAALKHLASTEIDGVPLNPRFIDCFMLGLYASLLLFVGADAARYRRIDIPFKWIVLLSAVAGVGSVTGMVLTGMVSRVNGGTGFAVIAVSSVLAGSFITSFGFGEHRTRAWWATVALATLAVLLFNLANGI